MNAPIRGLGSGKISLFCDERLASLNEAGLITGMETEVVVNVKVEALDEGGFLATSPDLPGLVVQGRTRAETMELAQANARILIEVYLSEKLPLPPVLRRLLKRKTKSFNLPLPAGRLAGG